MNTLPAKVSGAPWRTVPLVIGAALLLAGAVEGPNMALTLEIPRSVQVEHAAILETHTRIRAAVEALRRAAIAAHDTTAERLSAQLALHAQNEEEVLYPAAILVGELIRGRVPKN